MDKPTGFVAICRCGEIVAALDYQRMDRKDAGKELGDWLIRGMTVEPRFNASWSVNVTGCKCDE